MILKEEFAHDVKKENVSLLKGFFYEYKKTFPSDINNSVTLNDFLVSNIECAYWEDVFEKIMKVASLGFDISNITAEDFVLANNGMIYLIKDEFNFSGEFFVPSFVLNNGHDVRYNFLLFISDHYDNYLFYKVRDIYSQYPLCS